MKFVVKKTTASEQFVGLGYALVGFTGLVLAQFGDFVLKIMPQCTFHKITGLPCPSCGATRAGIYLAHLQIMRSLVENPIFFLLYTALLFYAINAVFGALFGKNVTLHINKKRRKAILYAFLTAVALNWAYLIIRTLT